MRLSCHATLDSLNLGHLQVGSLPCLRSLVAWATTQGFCRTVLEPASALRTTDLMARVFPNPCTMLSNQLWNSSSPSHLQQPSWTSRRSLRISRTLTTSSLIPNAKCRLLPLTVAKAYSLWWRCHCSILSPNSNSLRSISNILNLINKSKSRRKLTIRCNIQMRAWTRQGLSAESY